jgi:chemotaxis protein CheD
VSAGAAGFRYTPRTSPRVSSPIGGLPALPAAYVHPGQVMVSGAAGVLTTILGSCVSVCLHDEQAAIGGLNHYLLPNHGATPDQAGRYGPTAIDQLVRTMIARGATRERLVAHVVGGARVLATFSEAQHLGMRNATIARELLAAHRIPIISTDVGGTRGRKLIFCPRDGRLVIQVIGG